MDERKKIAIVTCYYLSFACGFFMEGESEENGVAYKVAAKMLNVQQVPIRENLSLEDFEREYASKSMPVVLRGSTNTI